ncbi:caspase family protein [Limnoraphis robusta Tam1]|uniref:caspase family protein n=1 Tax=Limnoraphis robusta TaxID=1118279 RepID=UPI002B2005A0|nr:caspase family protein [Limnoraphis robusta]MEA5500563.1 caspase family protein [Limnoraphis robusta BA-68 BA1]MEA5541370.1 caspase family protein [Limnoraphis robusta Tam1]
MIRRRRFLELTGSTTLATLGLNAYNLQQKSNRYGKVIAQDTPRKLALLVGINDYRSWPNLKGCVTDVDLQQELLIHRFGFNPQDIIRLTTDSNDQKPTRSNILTAFEEHLIKQAQPGDVVVFHFSGHGSQQMDPNPIQDCPNNPIPAQSNPANSTFVVADTDSAPDIMGRTLFLLMSLLKTENVTAVLDSCYSGGGTRGIHRVRSVSKNARLVFEELDYQQSLLTQLQWSQEEFFRRRCRARKGVVIASARADEEAIDADFGDFHAGAFTYFMTQYLWQEQSTVERTITQVRRSIRRKSRQNPLADGTENKPVYFQKITAPPTDAVVTNVQNNGATLWLGGLDENSLEAFSSGSVFSILDENNQSTGDEIRLEKRQGLVGEATWQKPTPASLQPGTLLREKSRTVPTDLNLRIGLDISIASDSKTVERAISNIKRLKVIPMQRGDIPYPGGVDYIFSRITADIQQQLQSQELTDLPPIGSLGLFTPELNPIPKSFGEPGESILAAINRLEAKLKAFLVVRLVKTTLNAQSSQLAVDASVRLVDQPNQILARTRTQKANSEDDFESSIAQLKLKQPFQFHVKNYGLSTLYVLMMVVDSQGGLYITFPGAGEISDEEMQLLPNQIQQSETLQAVEIVRGEALIIVSRDPMSQTMNMLRSLASELNQNEGTVSLQEERTDKGKDRGLDFMSKLFNDLRERSSGSSSGQLSTTDIATLSISFEISE